MKKFLLTITCSVCSCLWPYEAKAELARPTIWVSAQDRAEILEKVEQGPWARAELEAMEARVAEAVAAHRADPAAFLEGLPFEANPEDPDAHPLFKRIIGNMASLPLAQRDRTLQRHLAIGVDCGVLYFLTGDERYIRVTADILHASVQAMVQMQPYTNPFNDGLIYANDHLYDARVIGAQLPLLYDFAATWLRAGGKVWDVAAAAPVAFDFSAAQDVFRRYILMALNRGIIDCNWPVLEMASLAHNALALDSADERNHYLRYVTHIDTPHQDSLRKVLDTFITAGGVWPESLSYAAAVAELSTYITALLLRQEPAVPMPEGFSVIPQSMVRIQDFQLPDGGFVRFGDTGRRTARPWSAYQIAYHIGHLSEDAGLKRVFGEQLAKARQSGAYRLNPRAEYHLTAHPYFEPLALLWFEATLPEVDARRSEPALPVTDHLPFAGLVLQRNLPEDGDPRHALMAAVVGGHYIHAHASGMSLELFGAGLPLATPAGRGTYQTEEHENYRRLFASYNGVIVNGASATAGGWVNLGTDTVQVVSMEPRLEASPRSPDHSFTLTAFTDRQAGGGTARQERLVGIVRTSPTTGYFVDVFRSATGDSEQFHDYVLHAIGDRVTLRTREGPLDMEPQPRRFRPVPGAEWVNNRSYLYPGWHYFSDAMASATTRSSVTAEFAALQLAGGPVHLRLFIPGAHGREYASARAPVTRDAPAPYADLPTPVLVMRQNGRAWEEPFAVVHEPIRGGAGTGSVRAAEAIRDAGGAFSGLQVTSEVGGELLHQMILILPAPDSRFVDPERDLEFHGRYAVVSLDAQMRCRSLYIGEGAFLRYGEKALHADASGSAFTD